MVHFSAALSLLNILPRARSLLASMPSPQAFVRAMGLQVGAEPVRGWRIADVRATHTVVASFEKYAFDVTVCLSPQPAAKDTRCREADPAALASRIFRQLKLGTEKIVYSSYGSPYACSCLRPTPASQDIGTDIAGQETWTCRLRGIAIRRHDLPRLRDPKTKQIAPRDRERLASKFQIKTSRFATSRCVSCGDNILPGADIARPRCEQNTRGGWSHLQCLVEHQASS